MNLKNKIGDFLNGSKKFTPTKHVKLNHLELPYLAKKYFNLCDLMVSANQDFTKSLTDILGNNHKSITFENSTLGKGYDLTRVQGFGESAIQEVGRLSELVVEEISEIELAIAEAESLYDELTFITPNDKQALVLEEFESQEQNVFLGKSRVDNAPDIIKGYKVKEAILDAENALQPKIMDLEKGKKALVDFRNENFKSFAYDHLKMAGRNEIQKDHKDETHIIERMQKGLDNVKAIQNGSDEIV